MVLQLEDKKKLRQNWIFIKDKISAFFYDIQNSMIYKNVVLIVKL